MSLILVGVNHRTAPVDVRERLSVSDSATREIVQRIAAIPGIHGAAFLSTCNRAEALVSAEHEDVIAALVDFFAGRAGMTATEIEEHLYILRNRDVIAHMYRVAAGLESMIVGEPQIGGQVRTSFQSAYEAGTLDSVLQKLMEQTMRVSKRVRSETGIGERAVSVPYAAVELARKIFGDLRGLRILLVGAGEMAELTAQHLAGQGVERVFVANRAAERAKELALRFGGEAVRFEELTARLAECDILIASTSAPHHLVKRDHVQQALSHGRGRNLFLIDLSVPRNVDPDIGSLQGAYLYNIDDLQQVVQTNMGERSGKAVAAGDLIEEEVDAFLRHLATLDAVPTIVELQRHLEQIRQGELEKCLRRMGPMSAEQRDALEALTTSMVNKILHYPILRIKESAADRKTESESIQDTIRRIFGLR